MNSEKVFDVAFLLLVEKHLFYTRVQVYTKTHEHIFFVRLSQKPKSQGFGFLFLLVRKQHSKTTYKKILQNALFYDNYQHKENLKYFEDYLWFLLKKYPNIMRNYW